MGITDFFSEMYSAMSFTEVHAEEPKESNEEEESSDDQGDKEEKEEGESEGGDDAEEGGDDKEEEEDEEDEEEEEEEDEPVDPKPQLEEECSRSKECAPAKHHFDECVERVHAKEAGDMKGPKEDCVEEFFHLQHCATQCAAPKLFKILK